MNAPRPIGHVAASLTVVALAISHRIKHSAADAVLVCWRTDDGCIYLQQASHPASRAIERSSALLVINRYRKQPHFGWRDVAEDLEQARLEFAAHALADAMELAVCP